MAVVGQALTTPETGWTRYEESEYRIYFQNNSWATVTDASSSGGYYKNIQSGTITPDVIRDSKVKFQFIGTKLRFIAEKNTTLSTQLGIKIDGVEYGPFSARGTALKQTLLFEKLDLLNTKHTVEIYSVDGVIYNFDALDLGSDARLLHPILDEKFAVDDLGVGDCIAFDYHNTSANHNPPSNFGYPTLPMLNANPTTNVAHSAYFIMVGRDLLGRKKLVCDRPMITGAPDTYRVFLKNGIQIDEMAGSFTRTVSSEVTGYLSSEAVNYATYDKSIGWRTSTAINEWFKMQYPVKRRIAKMYYQAGSVDSYLGGVKNFRIESSNDGATWIPQYAGVFLNNGDIQTAEWNSTGSFIYWRMVLIDNYGAPNFNISILRFLEVDKTLSGKKAFMTALSGGLDAYDKENDYDKIIYEYNLNGKITAMENKIWHYLGLYELTSSIPTANTSYTVVRGTSSNYSTISASDVTAAFRPVLLIEQAETNMIFKNTVNNKFLYLNNGVVTESVSLVGVLGSSDKLTILNYIRDNFLSVDVYQGNDQFLMTFTQSNKLLEIKNYNIPAAMSKINSINIIGANLLCSIKKDDKNYVFKNSVWSEENNYANWNTVAELNSLTGTQLGQLLTTNDFIFSFVFSSQNSVLDNISVNVDISGYYGFADENDYDVEVSPDLQLIEFKNYSAGTYKITHVIGMSSIVSVDYLNVIADEIKEVQLTYPISEDRVLVTVSKLIPAEDNSEKVYTNLNADDLSFTETGDIVKVDGTFKNQTDYTIAKSSTVSQDGCYINEFIIDSKELIDVL